MAEQTLDAFEQKKNAAPPTDASDCCAPRPTRYDGVQVKNIPEVRGRLEEVSTDYARWITFFRCGRCGQRWEERFVERGHGEVPEVVKVEG
jgi:hypothetical protein